MRVEKTLVIGLMIVFLIKSQGFSEDKPAPALEKAKIEKQISYALGHDMVEKLKQDYPLDLEYFILGAEDAQKKHLRISQEKLKDLMAAYRRILQDRQSEKIRLESEANRREGGLFLEANKKKQGVVILPSGLQYQILVEGSGPVPKYTDTVECHYKGSFIDETVFDSTYERGEPAVFKVGQVIPGWSEALRMMKTGSTWMLYVPTDLAYGERGAGDMIKPGAALVFKLELIRIVE